MQTQLKIWREKRGLTVRKLGALSGVHYVSIVKMETGRLRPAALYPAEAVSSARSHS